MDSSPNHMLIMFGDIGIQFSKALLSSKSLYFKELLEKRNSLMEFTFPEEFDIKTGRDLFYSYFLGVEIPNLNLMKDFTTIFQYFGLNATIDEDSPQWNYTNDDYDYDIGPDIQITDDTDINEEIVYPPLFEYQNHIFRSRKTLIHKAKYYNCINAKICKARLNIDLKSGELTLSKEHSDECNRTTYKYNELSKDYEMKISIAKEMVEENCNVNDILSFLNSKDENGNLSPINFTKNDLKCINKNVSNGPNLLSSRLPGFISNICVFHQILPHQILVLATQEMIDHIKDATCLLVDGTFRCCPRLYKQLFTFMGYQTGKNTYFPLFFAFLPRKNQAVYKELFDFMEMFFSFKDFQYIYSDFEIGILNELVQRSIKGSVHGCRFHFSQCLQRKFKKLYKTPNFRQKALFRVFLDFVFLTTDQREEFYLIINSYKHDMKEFVSYFIKQWEKTVSPEIWSIEKKYNIEKLTNNGVEGYHSKLGDRVSNSNPNLIKIVNILLNYAREQYLKINEKMVEDYDTEVPAYQDIYSKLTAALRNYELINEK